jgi:hypothetical protein
MALMIEAASVSETSVNFYELTRRYNPEDGHLVTHRREKLKSFRHVFEWGIITAEDTDIITGPVCCNSVCLLPDSLTPLLF